MASAARTGTDAVAAAGERGETGEAVIACRGAYTWSRRGFLRRAASATIIGPLSFGVACKSAEPPARSEPAPAEASAPAEVPEVAWKFYTAEEGAILSAILDRLLPAGGELPGAGAAGVAIYLDRQLSLPDFHGLGRMMRAGVRFIDRAALRDHRAAFAALPPHTQDSVLAEFQRGAVGGMRFPQARFFDQLLRFALEGYLGDPVHGGNRDGCVWSALGIDPRCHNMYERCG